MLATAAVEAGLCQYQPLHRFPPKNVGLDDLIHIVESHPAIPDRVGINHQIGAMLTLVKAA